ncbi:MAG: hypothetical protein SGILL_001476 [Bacillariaceae sp.]
MSTNNDGVVQTDDNDYSPGLRHSNHNNNNNNNNGSSDSNKNKPPPRKYSREEWGDKTVDYPAKPGWGHGVQPEVVIPPSQKNNDNDSDSGNSNGNNAKANPPQLQHNRIMTAYLEPIDISKLETKPLPVRTSTKSDLKSVPFKEVNSCSRLTEQIPADSFPDDDPFLPWIHDVFPTFDGQFIQFVAQNKRRCRTGTTEKEKEIAKHMAPQVALFQHVAVKRISERDENRYKLTSHEDADEDGMSTRFICRFSNGEETFSVFNFSYEWASYRKKMKQMFHEDGRDNKQIHTSQLLFQCPVPKSLVEAIRTGASVIDDYATIFVDVIPIRTPPRYGAPNEFLPPYYKDFTGSFDAIAELWQVD